MRFDELNLIEPILRAVQEEGYETPTPIQEQTIPLLLQRRDLVGCAQTGTGKTAAFAIPILQLLTANKHATTHKKSIRTLILTPTRELALQIGESLDAYGRHLPLKTAVIFGGVSQVAQTNTLKAGVDILVATPGRLLDLIGQKFIELHHVEIFVLDEADRMLDMGFAPDVKRVIGMLPEIRQNMLFSATMPPEITKLVDKLLNEPAKVAVTPVSSTVEIIEQALYFVGKKEKILLLTHLLQNEEMKSVLVFTRTKHGADRVQKALTRSGISAAAIHGDKSQNNRVAALTQFKNKQLRVLVATDIAARGIDVDELSHVVNYDLPNVPETYVHRIGRTGRAGFGGVAISFCDEEEKAYLKDIQKLIGKQVPIVYEQPFPLDRYVEPEPAEMPEGMNRGRGGRPGQRNADGQRGRASQPGESPRTAPQRESTPQGRRVDMRPEDSQRDRAGTARQPAASRTETVAARRDGGRSDSVRTEGRRQEGGRQDVTRPETETRNAGRTLSSRASLPENTNRSESDRRNAPDPEAFERMARLLDGGRGRRPGGNRAGRSDAPAGHTAGSTRKPRAVLSDRPAGERSDRNGSRNVPETAGRGRSDAGRGPSDASRQGQVRSNPDRAGQINANRTQPRPSGRPDTPARELRSIERDSTPEPQYQGRASEQPGPFEKSSFLSKPLKSRPKGL